MLFGHSELLRQNLALNRTPPIYRFKFVKMPRFLTEKKFFKEIPGQMAISKSVYEGTFSGNLLIHRKDVIIKHGLKTYKLSQKKDFEGGFLYV